MKAVIVNASKLEKTLFPLIKFMILSNSIPIEKNKMGSFKTPEFQKIIEGVKKISHFRRFSLLGKKSTIDLNNANNPIKLSKQKINM